MPEIIPYFVVVRGKNPRLTLRRHVEACVGDVMGAVYNIVLAWTKLYGDPDEVKIERLEK